MVANVIAGDGEELAIRTAGQDWIISWHPPEAVPDGTPHGAAGVCVTGSGEVVLISENGVDWDLPAGRPEGDETWEQTLRREMLEEACATVVDARLLGFAAAAASRVTKQGWYWCAPSGEHRSCLTRGSPGSRSSTGV